MAPLPVDELATRLESVRARAAEAARRAGRAAADVSIVAVSKTYPARDVKLALACGQVRFGENRIQEAEGKFEVLRRDFPAIRLHLIGAVQSNKARDAVRVADVIESLDRPKLADAIQDAAQREGRLPSLLVQVNVGNEPQKAGIATVLADRFIDDCCGRFGDALVGLMCIPPADDDPTPYFTWLAACARRHGLSTTSMGMSGDFELAIAYGATHVRVGGAIFGPRSA